MGSLIYFDNAATTFPKPKNVYREVSRCIESYCGNPGRSGHSLSMAAQNTVYECRRELAEFFGAEAENTAFTLNTTYALNMAINAMLRTGDHVLISNIEHNSVYRPIASSGADYDIFNAYQPKEKLLSELKSKITPRTTMIICTHQSNICPLFNPIGMIGNLAASKGLYFIVDGAQSAGIYPIDIKRDNIDALCLPGHKGLYGIQGVGAVLFSKRFSGERARNLQILVKGGNGVNSLEKTMPDMLPERLEAGTLATPAIAGLLEGIRAVKHIGTACIREHEQRLYAKLHERLGNDEEIELYCPEFNRGQILLFNIKNIPSSRAAAEFDRRGVCLRSGFHCSPLAHRLLDTGPDGALRISLGAFNTLEEADRFSDILKEVIKTNR